MPQLAEDDDEERRRGLAAVVGVARTQPQHRERAAPQLVEHLPGLGVAPRVGLGGLVRGQHLEGPAEGFRAAHRRLPAGGQRIAPEEAGEHRDAGVDDPSGPTRPTFLRFEQVGLEILVAEREEVVERPLDRDSEALVALDAEARRSPGGALRRARRWVDGALGRVRRAPSSADARADPELELERLVWRDRGPPDEPAVGRIDLDGRPAHLPSAGRAGQGPDPNAALEASAVASCLVAQLEGARALPGRDLTLLAPRPADLRDVGEVRVDLEAEAALPGEIGAVVDGPSIEQAPADPPLELDVERVLGQLRPLRVAARARHAIPRNEHVRLRLGAREELRGPSLDGQSKARQDPGVVVEQARRIGFDEAVRSGAEHGVAGVQDDRGGGRSWQAMIIAQVACTCVVGETARPPGAAASEARSPLGLPRVGRSGERAAVSLRAVRPRSRASPPA